MYSFHNLNNCLLDYILLKSILVNQDNGISQIGLYRYLYKKGLTLDRKVSNKVYFYKKFNYLRNNNYIDERADRLNIYVSSKGKSYILELEKAVCCLRGLLNFDKVSKRSSVDVFDISKPLVFIMIKNDEEYKNILKGMRVVFNKKGIKCDGIYNIVFIINNVIEGIAKGEYFSNSKTLNIVTISYIEDFIDITSLSEGLCVRNSITVASDVVKNKIFSIL